MVNKKGLFYRFRICAQFNFDCRQSNLKPNFCKAKLNAFWYNIELIYKESYSIC